MLAAVQQDGWALQNVDPEVKKDREKIGLDHVASVLPESENPCEEHSAYNKICQE